MSMVPLPPGVHHMGNIQGGKGEKGDTGTFAYAEAVTLAPTEPATVELVGTESNRGVRFGVPAGAGGSNAVPDDEAISNNIEATYTLSNAAVQKVAGAEGFTPRSIVGEVPSAIEWPSQYPVRPSVRIESGTAIGSVGWTPHDYFDLYSEARSAPAITLYVNNGGPRTIDGVSWGGGSTSNDGLSPANPRNRLGDAIVLGNNAGGPMRIVVAAGEYPYGMWQYVGSLRVPEYDVAIIAVGGKVTAGAFAGDFTTVMSTSYPNCSEGTIPFSSTTIRTRVVDRMVVDADGVEWEYQGVATANECNNTPGSFYLSGDSILIHRVDHKVASPMNTRIIQPTTNLFIQNPINFFLGAEGVPGSGFELLGGQSGNIRLDAPAPLAEAVAVTDSTELKFAGHGESRFDSLVYGANRKGLVACFDTRAVAPVKDGFNHHTEGSEGPRPALLTVNCSSVDTGRPRSAADTSNNGLTLHGRATGIDVAGDYRRSQGGTVHNVNSSRHYLLGTTATDDAGDTPHGGNIEPTAFMTNNNAQMFLEAVRAGGRSTDYAFNAVGSSQIRLRDVPRPGMRVGGDVLPY